MNEAGEDELIETASQTTEFNALIHALHVGILTHFMSLHSASYQQLEDEVTILADVKELARIRSDPNWTCNRILFCTLPMNSGTGFILSVNLVEENEINVMITTTPSADIPANVMRAITCHRTFSGLLQRALLSQIRDTRCPLSILSLHGNAAEPGEIVIPHDTSSSDTCFKEACVYLRPGLELLFPDIQPQEQVKRRKRILHPAERRCSDDDATKKHSIVENVPAVPPYVDSVSSAQKGQK